jgi:hypothetical protein
VINASIESAQTFDLLLFRGTDLVSSVLTRIQV